MSVTRRDMLLGCLACSALACEGPGTRETGALPEDTGDNSTPPPSFDPCETVRGEGEEGWVAVPLATLPELAKVGGSTTLDLDGHAMIIAQVEGGCYAAIGRVCTHEGCTIEYRGGMRFICPCHGAAFHLDGSVQAGPTPIPVEGYPAVVEGEELWIQLP